MDTFYNTILETEEFVTAEEFLRRRERGEINPPDAQFVPQNPIKTGNFGVFRVKLKQPRYRVDFANMDQWERP